MGHPFVQLPNREIAQEEASRVLEQGEYLVLSTIDDEGMPYATPLSYVYEDGKIYIHTGVSLGRKKRAWLADAHVMGVVATEVEPCFAETFFTTRFASVMFEGAISQVTSSSDVRWALAKLCLKYMPEFKHEIGGAIERELDATQVWVIDIEEMTGKAGRRKSDSPSKLQ